MRLISCSSGFQSNMPYPPHTGQQILGDPTQQGLCSLQSFCAAGYASCMRVVLSCTWLLEAPFTPSSAALLLKKSLRVSQILSCPLYCCWAQEAESANFLLESVNWDPETAAKQLQVILHGLYGPPKGFKLSIILSLLPQGVSVSNAQMGHAERGLPFSPDLDPDPK